MASKIFGGKMAKNFMWTLKMLSKENNFIG